MSKFAVLGTVQFVADRREELLAILSAHRGRILAEEPGTVMFEILIPRDQQNTFFVYEEYTDEEAFTAHLNGASFARVIADAAEIITGLKTNRVTALDLNPDPSA